MRSVEFVPFLLTDQADIFTIRINGDSNTELEKFLVMFKDSENKYIQRDLESILKAISNISQNGALESYFRPEGAFNDRLVAIPIYVVPRNRKEEGTLRLYGIRISNSLLILGGGGLKSTRTYEEDSSLFQHVKTLQQIDKIFRQMGQTGIDIQESVYSLTIEID